MSFFDDLTGSGIGAGNAASAFGGKGTKNNIAALFGNPIFLQAIYSLSASGQDPFEVLGQFFVDGKTGKAGDKSKPGSMLKLGKGKYLDVGSLSAKLPEFAAQQEDANLKAQTATYEKLKGTPQFANIFNEANGNFSPQFDSEVSKAFGNLGGYALGKGVQSGFLDDPSKQAAILAPVGVQLAQYKQQVKKNAEAAALGYSGAGYLPQSNPAGLFGGQSAQSFLPGLFNAGSLFQNNQQFNSQMGFQESVAKNQAANSFMTNITGGVYGPEGAKY